MVVAWAASAIPAGYIAKSRLASAPGLPDLVACTDSELDLILASDALVLSANGVQGAQPSTLSALEHAANYEIPTAVLLDDTASSRADFDEMVSILRRYCDPLVRWLPLYADDGEHYVALLDLLDGRTLLGAAKHDADSQLAALTSERVAEFRAELSHLVLSDEELRNSLPIELLDVRWDEFSGITAFPRAAELPQSPLLRWLAARTNRWEPIGLPEVGRCGIAVTPHIVRMFGAPSGQSYSCNAMPVVIVAETAELVELDAPVPVGATLTSANLSAELRAPAF